MWALSVFHAAGSSPTTDLALNQTATASSADNDSDGAQNAVDGNPNTRWSSAYEDDQWIQVDLGSSQTFDQVAIVWEQAYADELHVQVSDDGSAWTDVQAGRQLGDPAEDQRQRRAGLLPRRQLGLGRTAAPGAAGPDGADRLAMHRDMNFTMIRNWIGSSNREEFYAACDENGILVWNDFWDAGYFPDDQPGYVDIATDTIRRYRDPPVHRRLVRRERGTRRRRTDAGLHERGRHRERRAALPAATRPAARQRPRPVPLDRPGEVLRQEHLRHRRLRLPHRDRHPGRLRRREHAQPGRRRAAAGRIERGVELPRLVADRQPAGRELPGRDRRPARRVEQHWTSSARKAQFVNYESMRAMFEAWNANLWQDASARAAVDVAPGLAQHGVADLRLRPRRQRRLLRRPQGLRAGARPGEPDHLAGARRRTTPRARSPARRSRRASTT